MQTADGGQFAVDDISINPRLHSSVATYATAIRAGGQVNGPAIGAIGIFFDWQSQSQAIVDRVRLGEDERALSRCMLVDAHGRIIAASDKVGVLNETIRLDTSGQKTGYTVASDGTITAFALTPGYETYAGLGWYGVIQQKAAQGAARKAA
jgi:hypothetical protein